MRRIIVIVTALAILSASPHSQSQVARPIRPGSVRMAVIGDMGTGNAPQYELAQRMTAARATFPFDSVIMLGDNIYGSSKPRDFEKKFSIPYKPLLDAGVKFYAALGNHDDPNERFYEPYNMNGSMYYTFKKGNVRFFALDSNYMDPKQFAWLEKELSGSGDGDWKIPFFHHPLYSSGKTHGPATDLRLLLEPLFTKYRVDVVFAGHEHFYERIKPQIGIYYFIEGASGQLRRNNLRQTKITAKGFDSDLTFMLLEFADNQMSFQTISRTGQVIDSGTIVRQPNSPTFSSTRAPTLPSRRTDRPAQVVH